MGSWTPNYNLYKPAPHEQYWGLVVGSRAGEVATPAPPPPGPEQV